MGALLRLLRAARRKPSKAALLLNEFRHQRRPSSLMGGAEPGARIPMEVFVKPAAITVSLRVERADRGTKTGSLALLVGKKETNQPFREVIGDLTKAMETARAGG